MKIGSELDPNGTAPSLATARSWSLFLQGNDRDRRIAQFVHCCKPWGICLLAAPWVGTVAGTGNGSKRKVCIILYDAALKGLKSSTWDGKAEMASVWDFKSCRLRHMHPFDVGPREGRAFSLSHQRHFLQHDASRFTVFFSSFLPLQLNLPGSTSVYVEQEFSLKKCSSGHLLNRDWQKSQTACCILWAFLVFLMKWAETLKLISVSSQKEMATLSLDRTSSPCRQNCPAPEFA